MKTRNVALFAALAGGLAGTASAQSILFTEHNTQAIYKLRPDNTITMLYQSPNPDSRLAGIDRLPGGGFIVADGPRPVQDPSTAAIFRMTGLLGGSPVVHVLAESDPIQNPIGVRYHAATGNVMAVNNPVQNDMSQPAFNGILGIDTVSGGVTQVYEQPPTGDPVPAYRQAARLISDPTGVGDFIVTSLNGGVHDGGSGDLNKGSTLWRLNVDGDLVGTVSLFADLSNTPFGTPLTFVRGIAAGPSGELYITDASTETLYRLDLDAFGEVDNISPVVSISDGSGMLDLAYHPGLNKLYFSTSVSDELFRVNLDGTGLELVASNMEARGFYIVPAPGALALLGIGALAAARRRTR